MLVDDERRHAELPQARAERDPALAAADDEHVGLHADAEFGLLLLPALQPGPALLVRSVLGAHRAGRPARLLEPLQLVQRGQERPRLGLAVVLDQPEQPAPATDGGLEGEPGGRDPVGLVRRLLDGEAVGSVRSSVSVSSSATPSGFSTVVMFQLKETRSRQKLVAANMPGRPRDVAGAQRLLEVGEPALRPLRGGLRGRVQRLRHAVSLLRPRAFEAVVV